MTPRELARFLRDNLAACKGEPKFVVLTEEQALSLADALDPPSNPKACAPHADH